ncbi:MAG: hypothetical protein KatS3mg035_1250 [Bacteroidia bacterium]|nr:MAG: hypothetical protein KatS3mg035_1250 [Bacteroidia bacterium]
MQIFFYNLMVLFIFQKKISNIQTDIKNNQQKYIFIINYQLSNIANYNNRKFFILAYSISNFLSKEKIIILLP